MKPPQSILAAGQPEGLFGDTHPLIEQIGSAEELLSVGAVNASLQLDRVATFGDLKKFLENYHSEILLTIELPFICRAYAHARKNEFLEIAALDQQLAERPQFQNFASASKRVGRVHLKRLRPMKDQRGLQRYLRAVDAGQAQAWHMLVYGITLAVFSLPVRQGLLNYAERVLDGLVAPVAERLLLSESQTQSLLEEMRANLPHTTEQVLAASSFAPLFLA